MAQAGNFGAVTISTNLAGRGTDIMLGGNAEFLAKDDMRRAEIPEEIISEAVGYSETENEDIIAARKMYAERLSYHKAITSEEAERVKKAGGLFILGTERHESRRIDNQLRGRSGRQGDPGETRFYISMTDDIMRLFGSERILAMMDTLGIDEDMPIDQKMVSNAIEQAQKTVESRHFQSRKHVLEFDDVMNQQRNLIYEQRRRVLDGEDISGNVKNMITEVITADVNSAFAEIGGKLTEKAQLEAIISKFEQLVRVKVALDLPEEKLLTYSADTLTKALLQIAFARYEAKEKELGFLPDGETPLMREFERVILLRVVDENWMEHIDAMDDLRQGVRLRAYGNVKPIDAYKSESFDMFEAMISGIRHEVSRRVFVAQVKTQDELQRKSVASSNQKAAANAGAPTSRQPVKVGKKIGRNDPCPCGKLRPNGLPMKYKDCCGRDK